MMRIDSHAPSANLDTITTTSTTAVTTQPTALMTMDRRHPFSAASPRRPSASQCRIIPAWESVNDVKTPTT